MNFACIRPERAVSRPSGYSHVRSINQSSPFVNGAAIFPPAQQRKPFPRFFAETVSLSKKSGCAGLFRQMLKKCLRPGAQTPHPPGTGGKRQPCGLLREAQSDPKVRRREASALWAVARSAKRPAGAPEGSVCPVGTWAEGPKRPGGVSKYKGCARSARRTPIFAREQIQGLRAASAQNADICEGAKRAEGAASVLRED